MGDPPHCSRSLAPGLIGNGMPDGHTHRCRRWVHEPYVLTHVCSDPACGLRWKADGTMQADDGSYLIEDDYVRLIEGAG